MFTISDFPHELFDMGNASMLTGILRGVEREALRVDPSGGLSLQAHPPHLGSALTHPQITTDFSEALLEFITPPTHSIDELFSKLNLIHKFTYSQLDSELLWSSSMPCSIPKDNDIPVALYGNSNNGQMKTAYRVGLGHRYGRTMQTVAGVHYNFSLPDAFWAFLNARENQLHDLRRFKNEKYFALIRNFRRNYWLLIYLFGASPALCKSFVKDRPHNLEPFEGDDHTLHLPYATSLRMGDLGYQSSAQESLHVCYNQQDSYIQSLCKAITTSHPSYESIGLKNADGSYKQLNTSLLQIENEFYSAIRPKRTANPGETALAALSNRGVEYIEVRCLDINPFDPLGFNTEQAYFVDTFLLYCALLDSPMTDARESQQILDNQKKVVIEGRKPNVTLNHSQLGDISLKEWGRQLLDAMSPVAEVLDKANDTSAHSDSLKVQRDKILDPQQTPSARILNELHENHTSFAQHSLKLSKQHKNHVSDHPMHIDDKQRMVALVEQSISEQNSMESNTQEDFDSFLREYFAQYRGCDSR